MTDFAATLAAADAAALNHLGGRVVYAPRVGVPVTVTGIFDAAYASTAVGGATVQNYGPAVTVRSADLPTNPEDGEPLVTVNGTVYTVREVQPDGMGLVVLLLRERP